MPPVRTSTVLTLLIEIKILDHQEHPNGLALLLLLLKTRASSPLDLTSSVTDYPVHRQPQQYPLRGTTSMQELQPGYQASGTGRPSRQSGHLSKSLSVRNVSSGSHGSHSATGPSLIQQQVYTTGMSHSTQTLPK